MTATPITTSEALTQGVRVGVKARYSPDHSNPQSSEWFILYTVQITNEGDQAVQLLTRHWTIVDGTGKAEEVHGPGVIGETPTLAPSQIFEYTSGCPLPTPFGTMAGNYEMIRADGTRFEAEIGIFELREPSAIH